jgi:hypothetical protein
MNMSIVIDCIIIAGCAYLAFIPFDKKRIRARWAKLAFAICAVSGIARGVIGLAWDSNWIRLGNDAGRLFDDYLYMGSGVILGFIFSLILSGQLRGSKRDME